MAGQQQLADQPDRQDGHQNEAEPVDGRHDGLVAVGVDMRAAPSEAATQPPSDPPQEYRDDGPQAERHQFGTAGAERQEAVVAPGRHGGGESLHRGHELRPDLVPHTGRQGRGIAAQQGLQDQLAAQTGHAFQQLVGAGDHDLALLEAALRDRGLLGQAFAFGLHGIGLGGRIGPGLQFQRRQQLLGVRQIVARQGGGGERRGPHVGCLLAQPVDLDRQQVRLLGAGRDTVELSTPQLDELAKRTLRLRHGLRRGRDACEQQHEPCEAG